MRATGRGVRVAILDSGVIADHPHVGPVAEGFGVSTTPSGSAEYDPDFRDVNGHGTACAAVVRWGAPDVALVAARVLDRQLHASAASLSLAFERLAVSRVDVVNVSLGIPDAGTWAGIEDSFQGLLDTGAIVVVAVRGDGQPSYPAAHPGVIAVDLDSRLDDWVIRIGGRAGAAFTASPFPRPIPGRTRTENFMGPSFAAPRIAAFAACIRERDVGATRDLVCARLANEARNA